MNNLSDYFDDYVEYFIEKVNENTLKDIADKNGIINRDQTAFIRLFKLAIIKDNKLNNHQLEIIGWVEDSLSSDKLYDKYQEWFSQF